ncbi:MAG: hypothetical protein ACXABG_07740 [Promethearchaeota archaeon]
MKCPNCNTEYSDSNQLICEYCGNELNKTKPAPINQPFPKIDKFLKDTGLKDLYQKIKKSLKE